MSTRSPGRPPSQKTTRPSGNRAIPSPPAATAVTSTSTAEILIQPSRSPRRNCRTLPRRTPKLPVDERALRDLLEESEDLHVDAMRQTRRALAHVVEQGEERRAHGGPDPDETRAFHHQRSRALKLTGTGVGAGIGAGIGAGVGVGALVLSAIGAHAAFADSATDVAS